jgi:hypothetical protein
MYDIGCWCLQGQGSSAIFSSLTTPADCLQTSYNEGPSVAEAKLEHPVWELRPREEASHAWEERLRTLPPPPGEPFFTEEEAQAQSADHN